MLKTANMISITICVTLIYFGFLNKVKLHIPPTSAIKLHTPKNAEAMLLPNPEAPSETPECG